MSDNALEGLFINMLSQVESAIKSGKISSLIELSKFVIGQYNALSGAQLDKIAASDLVYLRPSERESHRAMRVALIDQDMGHYIDGIENEQIEAWVLDDAGYSEYLRIGNFPHLII